MSNLLAETDAADLSTFAMEKQTMGVVNLVSHWQIHVYRDCFCSITSVVVSDSCKGTVPICLT